MSDYALDRAAPTKYPIVDYVLLTKPGIVALVLVATLTGIYLANTGLPDGWLVFWTLSGIGLAVAGSAILNNYTDMDIDRMMERTSSRALAAGTIEPVNALKLGLLFVTVSIAIHYIFINNLTAFLTGSAVFGYVVLYGIILKRRTCCANQVGGLAGALPPVIGYTAVTGSLDMNALILFTIMAIWQQPHALSLALKYREEYAKASIPVVPVAKGVAATKKRITAYTALLLPMAMVPYFWGMAGLLYLFTTLTLGVVYLGLSARFMFSKKDYDTFLFLFSIIYLTLLFASLVIDLQ